ncbi:MAG: hypothetical protein WD651_02565 [Acidimicrobiia bacterium]
MLAFAQLFRRPVSWFLLPPDPEDLGGGMVGVAAEDAAEAFVLAPDEVAKLVAFSTPEVQARIEHLLSRTPGGTTRSPSVLPPAALQFDETVREELVAWIRATTGQFLGDLDRMAPALRSLAAMLDWKRVELTDELYADTWVDQYMNKKEPPTPTKGGRPSRNAPPPRDQQK